MQTCGEWTVNPTNLSDNIVTIIFQQEQNLSPNEGLIPSVLKKIGIQVSEDCTVCVNNRDFEVKANSPLELGYGYIDVTQIKAKTAGVIMTVRYICEWW